MTPTDSPLMPALRRSVLTLVILTALTRLASAQSDWTWQNPLPTGNTLYSVCFTSATSGFAAGERGSILRSIDGGITWTLHRTGFQDIFMDVRFSNASTGFAVGDERRDLLHDGRGGTMDEANIRNKVPPCMPSQSSMHRMPSSWVRQERSSGRRMGARRGPARPARSRPTLRVLHSPMQQQVSPSAAEGLFSVPRMGARAGQA